MIKLNDMFVPIENQNKSHVTTLEAAFYLSRSPQTLRTWACLEKGPLMPIRISGRLHWRVKEIKDLLNKK